VHKEATKHVIVFLSMFHSMAQTLFLFCCSSCTKQITDIRFTLLLNKLFFINLSKEL